MTSWPAPIARKQTRMHRTLALVLTLWLCGAVLAPSTHAQDSPATLNAQGLAAACTPGSATSPDLAAAQIGYCAGYFQGFISAVKGYVPHRLCIPDDVSVLTVAERFVEWLRLHALYQARPQAEAVGAMLADLYGCL